jgi:hypothetical protein
MGSQFDLLTLRRMRAVPFAAMTMLVVAALATPAAAGAQATIRGTLYDDSTGVPLRGAVMLVDPRTDAPVVNTHSDSSGQFSLQVPAGVYQISAVRAGYQSTLSAPVVVSSGERMTILLPIATADARHKIAVVEHVKPSHQSTSSAALSAMSGFESRRAAGIGLQYDRSQFASQDTRTVGQFLESVPGVSVGDPSYSSSVTLMRNNGSLVTNGLPGNLNGPCTLGWFLDGRRMDLPGTTDPMTDALSQIPLDNVEGIEVFRGLSEMPVEYASSDLRCGAVAIWSRRN